MKLEELLQSLVAVWTRDATVTAAALTGSHARGGACPYSDVDLLVFTAAPPAGPEAGYRLELRGGHLVSFTTTTIAAKHAELLSPAQAIWAVPGLRRARPLYDRDRELGRLLERAHAFSWDDLAEAGRVHGSYELMGSSEEAHKVLRALEGRATAAVAYALMGLVLGLTRAVAVGRGVLVTENGYFAAVRTAAGPEWADRHRVAAGSTGGRAADRARAALQLYLRTAELLDDMIQPQHAQVIAVTVQRIRRQLEVRA